MNLILYKLDFWTISLTILWISMWFLPKNTIIRILKYFIFIILWFHFSGKDLLLSYSDIFWVFLGFMAVILFIFADKITPKVDSIADEDITNISNRIKALASINCLDYLEKRKLAKYLKYSTNGFLWIINLTVRVLILLFVYFGIKIIGWNPYIYFPIMLMLWRLDWYISDNVPNRSFIDLFKLEPQLLILLEIEGIKPINKIKDKIIHFLWVLSEWLTFIFPLFLFILFCEGIPYEIIDWIGLPFLIACLIYWFSILFGRKFSLAMKRGPTLSFMFLIPCTVLTVLFGKIGFLLSITLAAFLIVDELKVNKSYDHYKGKNIIKAIGILFLIITIFDAYPRLMGLRNVSQGKRFIYGIKWDEAKKHFDLAEALSKKYEKIITTFFLPNGFKIVPLRIAQKSKIEMANILLLKSDYINTYDYIFDIKNYKYLSKRERLELNYWILEILDNLDDREAFQKNIMETERLLSNTFNKKYYNSIIYLQKIELSEQNIKDIKRVEKIGSLLGDYFLITKSNEKIGDILSIAGKYKESKDYYEKALKIHIKFNIRAKILELKSKIAELLEFLGNTQEALSVLGEIKNNAKESYNFKLICDSAYKIGKILEKKGEKEKALENYKEAIDAIEMIRAHIKKEEHKIIFFKSKYEVFEKTISLLYELNKTDIAFLYIQKAKSRVLLDLLGTRMVANKEEDRELAQEENLLQIKINVLLENILREESKPKGVNSAKIKRLKKELEKTIAEHKKILEKIKDTNPRLYSLTAGNIVKIEDIYNFLTPNELFLEYFLTDEKVFLWVITKTDYKIFEFNIKIDEFLKKVENIYYDASSQYNTPSISLLSELYKIIVEPALNYFKDKNYLLIAPSDKLYFLPFEVLISDRENNIFLVDNYYINYYPSASVFVLNRKYVENKPAPEKPLFAVGDPVFSSDDPRYPSKDKEQIQIAMYGKEKESVSRRVKIDNSIKTVLKEKNIERIPQTGKEVLNIAAILGLSEDSSDIKIGLNATEEEVKKVDHTKYYFEHYATHGLLRGDIPGLKEPALVFSLPNQNDFVDNEGFWTMSEIFQYRTNADLVVLSACVTAMGEEVPGEGLIGLTRAFMYAGAPSVIASLWNVNDESTAKLMTFFYSYLKEGRNKTEALALAKKQLKKDGFYNPFYWAPFILIGESR